MALGANRWGKTEIRVSKVVPGDGHADFHDLSVQVLLEGDVERAHTEGDNAAVLPTDTMRNTVYGMAQEHLDDDLERFAGALCDHFLMRADVSNAEVSVAARIWQRVSGTGFIGGGSEHRTTRVVRGDRSSIVAGVEGLVLLKTTGSAFEGFPRDEFTILPEAGDRLLATSVTADWTYDVLPEDTSATWAHVRETLVSHFFDDWSGSVQHQGYLMGEAVLAAIPEISDIAFRLPNQHHLPFDLSRFGMEWTGNVFHPVSEPFGDIYLTVTR